MQLCNEALKVDPEDEVVRRLGKKRDDGTPRPHLIKFKQQEIHDYEYAQNA